MATTQSFGSTATAAIAPKILHWRYGKAGLFGVPLRLKILVATRDWAVFLPQSTGFVGCFLFAIWGMLFKSGQGVGRG